MDTKPSKPKKSEQEQNLKISEILGKREQFYMNYSPMIEKPEQYLYLNQSVFANSLTQVIKLKNLIMEDLSVNAEKANLRLFQNLLTVEREEQRSQIYDEIINL